MKKGGPMTSADWQRLLPQEGHRFRMGLQPGNAARFWSDQDPTGALWNERQHWLEKAPELFRVEDEENATALAEARAWISQYTLRCEPDWVLLSDGGDLEPVVLGGEVALPSAWSLPDKKGRPLSQVHAPVPGLAAVLGRQIQVFCSRIQVDAAWERENWGLSADAELNHHPLRMRPQLGEGAGLSDTWLRLERQFLTRLPKTRCLLFGIRLSVHRLDELASVPTLAAGLLAALREMEPEVAAYKGLTTARASLITALLDATGSGR